MKGKALVKIIQERGLEEYDIEFSFVDGYSISPNVRTFKIDELDDVGHSGEVAIFGIEEK